MRCLLSKDIEISVIRSNFEEDSILAVPLIEHGGDVILLFVEPESHRAFIGLVACIALHAQLHHSHYRRTRRQSIVELRLLPFFAAVEAL